MNRKLLVIAIVPLLVGFAGATAFSEWQGSITKTINVTTASVYVTEKVECVGAYIAGTVLVDSYWTENGPSGPVGTGHVTPFQLDGDGTHVPGCPTVSKCSGTYDTAIVLDGAACSDPDAPSLGSITYLGDGITGASYNLDIYGLAPGDWIDLAMFEQVVSIDGPTVTLTAHLAPSALAATVSSVPSGYAVPLGASTSPAAWTWLADAITTPCESQYGLVSGSPPSVTLNPLNVGPSLSPKQTPGLEYCDSGPLGPGIPTIASLPLGPGATVTVGSLPYAYILVGLDESTTDATMDQCASLVYSTTAAVP